MRTLECEKHLERFPFIKTIERKSISSLPSTKEIKNKKKRSNGVPVYVLAYTFLFHNHLLQNTIKVTKEPICCFLIKSTS